MRFVPRPVPAIAGLVLAIFLSGCSGSGGGSGAAPKPGTIAHAWMSAGETYKQGDYARTMEYLSRVASNQNEYRDRARLWLLVVSSGVADGYMELASAYETGSKINKVQGSDWRKRMMAARNLANTAALQYAEAAHEYMEKNKEIKPAFDFPFPAGQIGEPVQLAKVNKGYTMQDADHDVLAKAIVERGVVKAAAAMAGEPDDPAKAAAKFAQPPRDAFLFAVAEGLYRKADLYCSRKLDIPKRGNALCKEAQEALAMLPDSKQKKDLEAKIKEELKRHKIAA